MGQTLRGDCEDIASFDHEAFVSRSNIRYWAIGLVAKQAASEVASKSTA